MLFYLHIGHFGARAGYAITYYDEISRRLTLFAHLYPLRTKEPCTRLLLYFLTVYIFSNMQQWPLAASNETNKLHIFLNLNAFYDVEFGFLKVMPGALCPFTPDPSCDLPPLDA